ncbi:MAG: exopolyphosphatase [Planctomycetota bacterium]|nr:MAG: exopolyphosphatase [Planctomycetota bacterium]
MPETLPDAVAAVDLGSNSFHMVVARVVQGQVHIVDRLRERVALAEGLDQRREITEEAQNRALACLERFGQRLRDMPRGSVRAAGTSALRQARNAQAFLGRARRALGHPIEILPGTEEARLIYLGVIHSLSNGNGRRLVVDIGGGSSECILGEGLETLLTDSLYMGCVNYSLRFFSGGEISAARLDKAEIAAALELEPIQRRYQALGWERAVGSSGTILAVDEVLRANGWSSEGITPKALDRLRRALIDAGQVGRLDLAGLAEDRKPVFAGGVAILRAFFLSLRIEQMTAASGAMREGLLYDLLGRIQHEDARDQTIRRMSQRYQVDLEQAARVERTALGLLRQVAGDWGLEGHELLHLLSWAARLHEIGLSIAYSGYHKHSSYLILSSDMPGFSREDKEMLAALVLGQRRKLGAERVPFLGPARVPAALRLSLLLRLAVRLNRSRSPDAAPRVKMQVEDEDVRLSFPDGWLDSHPLTRADLEEEAAYVRGAGFKLSFR